MTGPGAMLPTQTQHVLSIGVGIAALWTVVALSAQLFRTRAYGRRVFFAAAAADPRRGVAYAFGPGMLPTAKESVRTHLPAYLAGVGFHLGLFAGFVMLALSILGAGLDGLPLWLLRAGCLLGALAGASLLARRILDDVLRSLSSPDDYIANLLCTAFAALSFSQTFDPAAGPWFLGSALLLLVYVPLGKIRHCLFFFPARYHSAYFFGRRGAYPPHA